MRYSTVALAVSKGASGLLSPSTTKRVSESANFTFLASLLMNIYQTLGSRVISSYLELDKDVNGCRGVQYVHWLMHKCIMVKVGGKRNTHKVCKKQVNFYKTGGKFVKVGGNNNFCETGWKCTETGEIGGNSKLVVND